MKASKVTDIAKEAMFILALLSIVHISNICKVPSTLIWDDFFALFCLYLCTLRVRINVK